LTPLFARETTTPLGFCISQQLTFSAVHQQDLRGTALNVSESPTG
jgi:hypothetical protein